ncbi:PH (Pleckstrin Homology) domain-containing protein [Nocardia mexicana]|uniref:PH (Pleckstrin Homology) domain-containing protein n=2 Tax=Nocardia mexicana TaxID=279262 RepID=A0A370GZU4_9NOCA|nr:PH (Pleckstrin Homology) domain-containing protein [Nocardia mexicana]
MLAFCVAFPFFGWPAVLWVLFVIPAVVAVWIERTRTTVSERGLDLRTLFGSRHVDWSQIKGLRIPKRGYVRVHLLDDSEVALPAVGYDRLRTLVEASNGRIPDPFVRPEADDTELDATLPADESGSPHASNAEADQPTPSDESGPTPEADTPDSKGDTEPNRS